jgi:large subunit ribosomal protein L4
MQSKIYSMDGKEVKKMKLSDDVFGVPMNKHLIWEVVKMYQNNARAGSSQAKNRSMVRGGSSKPYRQKGTGRARQGTIRAPHYVGGGVAFGPGLRDYTYHVPKKVRRKCLNIMLSDKVTNGEFIILDSLNIPEAKTRHIATMLKNLKLEGRKVLIVLTEVTSDILIAVKNIPGVVAKPVNHINTLDVISSDIVLTTEEVVKNMN